MSAFGRVTLILYFIAYLLQYYYKLKTKCNHQKLIIDLESRSKNISMKVTIIMSMRYIYSYTINEFNKTKPFIVTLRLS